MRSINMLIKLLHYQLSVCVGVVYVCWWRKRKRKRKLLKLKQGNDFLAWNEHGFLGAFCFLCVCDILGMLSIYIGYIYKSNTESYNICYLISITNTNTFQARTLFQILYKKYKLLLLCWSICIWIRVARKK